MGATPLLPLWPYHYLGEWLSPPTAGCPLPSDTHLWLWSLLGSPAHMQECHQSWVSPPLHTPPRSTSGVCRAGPYQAPFHTGHCAHIGTVLAGSSSSWSPPYDPLPPPSLAPAPPTPGTAGSILWSQHYSGQQSRETPCEPGEAVRHSQCGKALAPSSITFGQPAWQAQLECWAARTAKGSPWFCSAQCFH